MKSTTATVLDDAKIPIHRNDASVKSYTATNRVWKKKRKVQTFSLDFLLTTYRGQQSVSEQESMPLSQNQIQNNIVANVNRYCNVTVKMYIMLILKCLHGFVLELAWPFTSLIGFYKLNGILTL